MTAIPFGGTGRENAAAEPSLKRVMGPWLLLLFIIGDVLGTGIYALTGQVAKQVGGAVWLPFVVAFLVALITAFSYLELVTKYPKAAGAALYTHKAFSTSPSWCCAATASPTRTSGRRLFCRFWASCRAPSSPVHGPAAIPSSTRLPVF